MIGATNEDRRGRSGDFIVTLKKKIFFIILRSNK